MDHNHKKYRQKKLTMGECAYVQGQVLITLVHRKTRSHQVLTRLSNKKTQRRELSIFETYSQLKKTKNNELNSLIEMGQFMKSS